MVCPQCGEHLHRSHSRNFSESFIKKITSYKSYRCSECGWRGMVAPVNSSAKGGRWRSVLMWVVGLIIALMIGIYAVYDLQSSVIP